MLAPLVMTLLMIVGFLMMFVILLQRGRGGGLAGAFGGAAGQSALGTRAGDVFTKITIVLAVVWVLLAAGAGFALRDSSKKFPGGDKAPEVTPEVSSDAKDGDKKGSDKAGDDKPPPVAEEGDATDLKPPKPTPKKPEKDATDDAPAKKPSSEDLESKEPELKAPESREPADGKKETPPDDDSKKPEGKPKSGDSKDSGDN